MPGMGDPDIRILGSGIVSRCMGLALAQQGLGVALQAGPAPAPDAPAELRAYALNPASVTLLRRLKVWDALPAGARTPVHDMQVRGDAPGGQIRFSAWQQAVPELAWIVDARALETVLDAATGFAARLQLASQPGPAPLTIVAEGKASAAREQLGVRFERHAYGQWALAARLRSDLPHGHTAHQWFRSPDILALLPLEQPAPGHSFALVWSLPEAEARRLQAASADELNQALNEATQGAAGSLSLAGERALWPLSLARASALTGPGWALVGDAAHVVHPLAGQGLNLGLADVVALADTLATRESWRGVGDPVMLRRYARRRALATQAMAGTTDGLWALFAAEQPWLRELRNRGMGLVNELAPLKRWLIGRALQA